MKQWRQDDLDYFQFDNLRERLNSNILLTSSVVKNQLAVILAPYDLTLTQYQALQILKLQNGLAISTLHLRERMLDKMSDTPKIVDRLLKKGLVFKNTSNADRRLVDIFLSPSGKSLLEEIEHRSNLTWNTSAALTLKEVETLNHLLNKIRLAPAKKSRF
jgi:MarR family transcriptional regulator, 2-MHQ and catechol-resistance regulon repressor